MAPALSFSAGPASAPAKTLVNPQALVDSVGQAVWTLESAHRDLSANPLDEDAVIERVGQDPAKLREWVRTKIENEPYRGFLKGATGALVSGRANSADKALLLAELLIKVGFKAQLAHGDPPAGVIPPVLPVAAVPSDAPDEKALALLAAHTGIDAARLRQLLQSAAAGRAEFQERLWNRTISDLETLSALLDGAKIPVPPQVTAAIPSDHWWVRIPAGDLDPVFEVAPPKAVAVFDPAHLPPTEYHRVALRVMIRKDQVPANVLEASYRSAELFGKTISVANLPLDAAAKLKGISPPNSDKVLDVLAAASKFQPMVMTSGGGADDGHILSGKGFDLKGEVFDVAQGRFSGAQNLGTGIGGLFGGGEKGDSVTKLTAVWIEMDLIAPGQPAPTRIRRDMLIDVPGLSPRQKVFDLLATREILLLPEEISGDFLTTLTLNSVSGWSEYLSKHAKKDLGKLDLKSFKGQPQFNSTLYTFGVGRGAALRQLCDGRYGVRRFAHVRPTAVSYVLRFIDGKRPLASRSIDILENAIVPAGPVGKPAGVGWRGNFCFACGVLDTALEHEILRGGEVHRNASVALERSLLDGAAPVIARGTLPVDLKLSETARASIEPDLEHSAFVVVPGELASWYRVGLGDGLTLGFVEGGGGQEATEYSEIAEILIQLREIITFYGNMGRCLGQAIGGPLSGNENVHENLTECFKGLCDMITMAVSQGVDVDPSWTNVIICKTTTDLWEGFCEKLWEKLGEGEHGGGEGGG
jgi:hypothetical protein